jgi:glycosyltransferase involved in cell wall biosynthesis
VTAAAQSGEASAPRKVLLLCDAYWHPHGGTEGQILALVANLPPPWQAELWVTHHSPYLDANPFPCPARSLRLGGLSRPWTWWRVRRLVNAVRNGGFALIQTFMGDSSVIGPTLGTWAGVPVLVSRRDLGFWQSRAMVAVLRRTRRRVAGYLANAEAVKRHVIETEGARPEDVAVVHNGLALSGFDGPRAPELREAHGIPDDAKIVLLLANLKPLKRQADLVEAAGSLIGKHPRLHVLLLGQGPEEEVILRRLADRVGMATRLTIHHAQGGAIDFVKEAAIGVLTSDTEGLSNAILEYMACGLPVVATNVGGNPDLVADGVNGRLYEPRDVGALAAALDRILSDDALRERMGIASRERLRAGFGLERMVVETVAVYERVLAGLPVGAATTSLDPAGER